MSAEAVLRRAREILSPRGAWRPLAFARDAEGRVCPVFAPGAVSYCLVGAITLAAAGEDLTPTFRDAFKALALGESHAERVIAVQAWNDREGRTQAEVLDKLDDVLGALDALGEVA